MHIPLSQAHTYGPRRPPAHRAADDPPFPACLKGRATRALSFTKGGMSWHRPVTLAALVQLVQRLSDADVPFKLCVGNQLAAFAWLPQGHTSLVDVRAVPGFQECGHTPEAGVSFGPATTISALRQVLQRASASQSAETCAWACLRAHLGKVASTNLRSSLG